MYLHVPIVQTTLYVLLLLHVHSNNTHWLCQHGSACTVYMPYMPIVSTCVHMKVWNPKAKLHVRTYTKSYSVHVHTHAQTSPHLAGVL